METGLHGLQVKYNQREGGRSVIVKETGLHGLSEIESRLNWLC